jgi:nickel/cobalt transporter (NiCoT) family protein
MIEGVRRWLQGALGSDFPLKQAATVLGILAAINIVAFTVSSIAYNSQMPDQASLLVVAYTLGLRHAFDADHIAAIDNVTRRLVESGRKPVTVGLFFALGHSTIVILATVLIAVLSASVMDKFDDYSKISKILGPSISCGFLFLVGIINCISIFLILKTIKQERARHTREDVDWDQLHESGGFFSRVFGKWLFRVIDEPWKMYPVGFLFGLGFDTSTEISLLAIAALQSASGSSTWLILCLPILFTCGMALVDTLDGMLMLGVYGWAEVSPLTKLYYNLVITTVSCFFAILIALVQLFGIIQTVCDLDGTFWDGIGSVSDSFGFIGAAAVVSFLAGWLISRYCFRTAIGDLAAGRPRSPGALLQEEEEEEEEDVGGEDSATMRALQQDSDSVLPTVADSEQPTATAAAAETHTPEAPAALGSSEDGAAASVAAPAALEPPPAACGPAPAAAIGAAAAGGRV